MITAADISEIINQDITLTSNKAALFAALDEYDVSSGIVNDTAGLSVLFVTLLTLREQKSLEQINLEVFSNRVEQALLTVDEFYSSIFRHKIQRVMER